MPAYPFLPTETMTDPRNDDDFDTWTYGTEPLPEDQTWRHRSDPSSVSTELKPSPEQRRIQQARSGPDV